VAAIPWVVCRSRVSPGERRGRRLADDEASGCTDSPDDVSLGNRPEVGGRLHAQIRSRCLGSDDILDPERHSRQASGGRASGIDS
jgi:hypothetical protein